MQIGRIKSLPGNFRPLLALVAILFCYTAYGQYNPSIAGTTSNKPYAPNAAAPTDSRSYYYDAVNFVWRPYQSTAEVLFYLNLPKYRTGQFDIIVNTGGVLSGGVITGGVNTVYYFKNGTADSNLVVKVSATVDPSLFLLKANNLSDLPSIPSAKTSLGLNNVDNTSDATKWAATATLTNKTISGSNNTLINIPNSALTNNSIGFTIGTSGSDFNFVGSPAPLGGSLAFNFPYASASTSGRLSASDWNTFNSKLSNITGLVIQGTGISITGSGTIGSPFQINATGGSGGTGNADSIRHYFVDTGASARNLYTLAFDSTNRKWILTAPGTGGGGTGTVTSVSVNTANGFAGTVANASTVPSITLTTSVTGLLFGNGTAMAAATVNSPLTYSAGTLGIQQANTSQNGFLSSTDWNTFNGKQAALSGTGYLKFSGTTASYLTPTQVTADLNLFTTTLQGLVPAPGTVTGKVLTDNGTWQTNGNGTVTSVALTTPSFLTTTGSPITSTGTFAVTLANQSAYTGFGNWTNASAAPTFGKIPYQAFATGTANTLLGYDGSGNPSPITAGTNITISSGVISATGGAGGITGNLKRNDSLFSVSGTGNTYFGRDSVQWGFPKVTIVTATSTNARNDANSVVSLPDGRLIVAWSSFGTQVGDVDSACILWSISTDHGRTWSAPDTAVALGGAGSYIPSLAVRNDGTVVMLYLYQPNINVGQINKVTLAAPYSLHSWSAPSTVYAPSGIYQSPAGDRILKTKSGSWLYATNIASTADHSSASGNYYAKILKSVDQGSTWSAMSYQVASPDSLNVEAGLYQTEAISGINQPPIYLYWRNRSGYVGMSVSSDTGNSFSAPFPTSLYAPNATTSIKYIERYKSTVAIHNKHDIYSADAINGTTGRYALQVSVSPNHGVDWYRQGIVDSTTGYYFFEPALYYDSTQNEIFFTYSRFNNAGSLCNLMGARMPLYHLVSGLDVHEQNSILVTPSYTRAYSGNEGYNQQGLRFLTMTQKEIGGNNITTLGTGDYFTLSQANSSAGRFAALIQNKTGSANNGMVFETTTKAESSNAPFVFSAIDSGVSNSSGTFPSTSLLFSVLNNYLNTGLGLFLYGSGELDLGANNTSTYLNIYNNVLGKNNAYFRLGNITGGNTSFAPWFHMKGNNTPYGMTWDCNTSTNAPNSSFWIDGNNNGAAIANANSLFRVDNNGGAVVGASTKVRLQLLGDGRLAQNTLAPTAMFTIQGSTTQSQIGTTGWRSSFLAGTYVDNVTGNGNVIRYVASDAHASDSFATSNTVTYSNLANGYFKGNMRIGGGLTVSHAWAIMADSGDVYINGQLNLKNPLSGTVNDSVLMYRASDSSVRKIAASLFGGTPGGSNTQVQFNNSGTFGGSANLTWASNTLTTTALAISTLANAGANDSVLTWDPVSKAVRMKSGTFTLKVANGLTPSVGNDSLYWGGSLVKSSTSISGTGTETVLFTSLGQFSVFSTNITLSGYLGLSSVAGSDANTTWPSGKENLILSIITANRTLTLPTLAQGSILTINNWNGVNNGFVWNLAGAALLDEFGNTVTSLKNATNYFIQSTSTGGQWQIIAQSGQSDLVTESSNGTMTLGSLSDYVFNGTTTTWTLPPLSGCQGRKYYIKNAGSGSITLQRSGSDNIYDVSSVTSITITAGTARIVVGGPSFWYIE